MSENKLNKVDIEIGGVVAVAGGVAAAGAGAGASVFGVIGAAGAGVGVCLFLAGRNKAALAISVALSSGAVIHEVNDLNEKIDDLETTTLVLPEDISNARANGYLTNKDMSTLSADFIKEAKDLAGQREQNQILSDFCQEQPDAAIYGGVNCQAFDVLAND